MPPLAHRPAPQRPLSAPQRKIASSSAATLTGNEPQVPVAATSGASRPISKGDGGKPPAKAMQTLKRALAGSLTQFAALFTKMDRDKSGTIDREEFSNAMKALKLPGADKATCDAMFDEFDVDGSGDISFQEYVNFTLLDVLSRSATRVINLFKLWDVDRSGTIDLEEFRRAIKTIGFDVPRDSVDGVFAELDEDGSGEIDYDELNRVLRRRAMHNSRAQSSRSPSPNRPRPGSAPLPLHKRSPATWVTEIDTHRGGSTPTDGDHLDDEAAGGGRGGAHTRKAGGRLAQHPNTVASASELRYNLQEVRRTAQSLANLGITKPGSSSRPPSPSESAASDAEVDEVEEQLLAYLRSPEHRERAEAAAAALVPSTAPTAASSLPSRHAAAAAASVATAVGGSGGGHAMGEADRNGQASGLQMPRASRLEEEQKAVDAERSRLLAERQQLVRASLRKVVASQANRVCELLLSFDPDGNGQVDRIEFRKAVRVLLEGHSVAVADEDIDATFAYFDDDQRMALPRGQLERRLKKYAGLVVEQSIDIRTKAGRRRGSVLATTVKLDRSSSAGGLDEQLRGILVANAVRVIDLFRQWDEDGSGLIDFHEFALGMRHLGLDASTDEVHRLFESFDPDQSGSIDYRELNKLLRHRAPPPAPGAHRQAPTPLQQRSQRELLMTAAELGRAKSSSSLVRNASAASVGTAASVSFAAGVGGSHAATSAAGIGAAAASVKRGQPQHRSAASIVTHIPEKRWREPPIDATQEPPIEPKSPALAMKAQRQAPIRRTASAPFVHSVLAVAPSMRATMAAIDSLSQASGVPIPIAAQAQIDEIRAVAKKEVAMQRAWSAATSQPRYSWGPAKPGTASDVQGTPVHTMTRPPSYGQVQSDMRLHIVASRQAQAPSVKSNKSATRPAPKLLLSRSVDELSQMWLQPRPWRQVKEGWKPSRKFGPY